MSRHRESKKIARSPAATAHPSEIRLPVMQKIQAEKTLAATEITPRTVGTIELFD